MIFIDRRAVMSARDLSKFFPKVTQLLQNSNCNTPIVCDFNASLLGTNVASVMVTAVRRTLWLSSRAGINLAVGRRLYNKQEIQMNEVTGQTQYQTPITRKNGKLRRNGPIENISAVRRRARMHIDQGAVTDDYTADRNVAFGLLNDALATELVCVIRYKRHHIIAMRLKTEPAAPRSLQYANEEQAHREVVAARIVQLGSEPDFSPERLADRSNSQYAAGNSLYELM
jgi:hypothetical protein